MSISGVGYPMGWRAEQVDSTVRFDNPNLNRTSSHPACQYQVDAQAGVMERETLAGLRPDRMNHAQDIQFRARSRTAIHVIAHQHVSNHGRDRGHRRLLAVMGVRPTLS